MWWFSNISQAKKLVLSVLPGLHKNDYWDRSFGWLNNLSKHWLWVKLTIQNISPNRRWGGGQALVVKNKRIFKYHLPYEGTGVSWGQSDSYAESELLGRYFMIFLCIWWEVISHFAVASHPHPWIVAVTQQFLQPLPYWFGSESLKLCICNSAPPWSQSPFPDTQWRGQSSTNFLYKKNSAIKYDLMFYHYT